MQTAGSLKRVNYFTTDFLLVTNTLFFIKKRFQALQLGKELLTSKMLML